MATTIDTGISYPAEGQGGLTSAQWRAMYATSDGVMSDTASPAMGLSLGPEANTVHVSAGKLMLDGYTLEMAAEEAVPVPTATGTYQLRAFLDPALLPADPNPDPDSELPGPRQTTGPIQLWIGTAAEVTANTTGGKVSLPLWYIARVSGQSILLATLSDKRQYMAPQLAVGTEAALPAPTDCLGYTTCFVIDTGDTWQVQYTGASGVRKWEPISHPVGIDFPLNGPLSGVSGEPAPRYRRQGSMVYNQGAIKRTTGNLNTGNDVALGQYPAGFRPSQDRRVPMPLWTTGGWRMGVGRVQADGWLYLSDSSIPTGLTVNFVAIDDVYFRAEL